MSEVGKVIEVQVDVQPVGDVKHVAETDDGHEMLLVPLQEEGSKVRCHEGVEHENPVEAHVPHQTRPRSWQEVVLPIPRTRVTPFIVLQHNHLIQLGALLSCACQIRRDSLVPNRVPALQVLEDRQHALNIEVVLPEFRVDGVLFEHIDLGKHRAGNVRLPLGAEEHRHLAKESPRIQICEDDVVVRTMEDLALAVHEEVHLESDFPVLDNAVAACVQPRFHFPRKALENFVIQESEYGAFADQLKLAVSGRFRAQRKR
mmetsp:Transcript_4724/g.13448  ORF Transcript_4724/g.13448 Transcript_4724/m.13448 type:complete len:259 (+) Transcript_4724:2667-3443(+)